VQVIRPNIYSAIYSTIRYIFDSVWGHENYSEHLWYFLAVVYFLLLVVTGLTVICLVYLQISAEDWRWWWPSFFWGSSGGIWMFCYSIYFYFVTCEVAVPYVTVAGPP
jgi:hypothetical protein